MKMLPRRDFVHLGFSATFAAAVGTTLRASDSGPLRKMRMCLSCGAIGISADQRRALRLAEQYGFEAVEASADYLSKLDEKELSDLLAEMKTKEVTFGAAGLPVEFRQGESKFSEGLKELPKVAAALWRAGVERCGTWLMPGDKSKTYLQNFKQHGRRLRECAVVLRDHGLRLGLEYVGTTTSRDRSRYPFIHCMAEMRELIAEIATGNVGLVLDSWHWWQADDTNADILALQNADVVSVDLNDAPTGVAKDQQLDGRRELPAATGVIDLAGFLNALNQIGYDGPVRAEPFNKALNSMGQEEACAATAAAMKKAFSLIQ
jgi:sugar phosphate isomerase/epimerase